MKTVAIIPARGGSKGIKNKNIIDLNGKELIYYSLKACFDCQEIDHVAVSTDSEMIANVAKSLFANVIIIKRPSALAGDNATSETAVEHAILELDKSIDGVEKVVFVQATSPLTGSDDLSSLIELLNTNESAMFYTEDYGHFSEIHDMKKPRVPRQKRKPLTREAGNAWAFNKDGFLKYKSRLFGKIGLCKIELCKSYEIDEPEDVHLLSCLLVNR